MNFTENRFRLWRIVLLVFISAGLLTALYESIKQVSFPSISIWQSHVITVLFVALLASVVAVVPLLESRISKLLFEISNDAILVTDSSNKILDANPAFTRITGYTLDEIQGKDPKILHSGKQSREFYEQMWKQLVTNNYWEGELWNRKKNGELYAQKANIYAIRRPSGIVHRYIAQFSDITKKKLADEEIWNFANYDALTNLPNRRLFYDRLTQAQKQAGRSHRLAGVLYIDLDNFKLVNDRLGHEQGDHLLVEAAKRISDCVRDIDTVARLGGDEFAVVLADLQKMSQLEKLAEKISLSLSRPYVLQDVTIHYVTSSIGGCTYPDLSSSMEDLINKADSAMYRAKAAGRNCWKIYHQDDSST